MDQRTFRSTSKTNMNPFSRTHYSNKKKNLRMDHTTTQCVNSFVGGSVRSPRRLIAFATVVLTVVLLLVLIPPRNHEETGTNPSRNNALLLHTTKQSYVDNPDNKQHLSALQAKTRTRATTSNNNNNNPKNKSNTVTRSLLSEEELQQLLENIKGNDNRLFRWDAQKLTVKRREFHGCDQLIQAATVVTQSDASVRARSLAMEFLTFCITDSPEQRQRFSTVKDIHTAVIALVTSSNARVSSLACHLIYISSFSNKVNHQTFLEHNVVQALANVILNKDSSTSSFVACTISVCILFATKFSHNCWSVPLLFGSICSDHVGGRRPAKCGRFLLCYRGRWAVLLEVESYRYSCRFGSLQCPHGFGWKSGASTNVVVLGGLGVGGNPRANGMYGSSPWTSQ